MEYNESEYGNTTYCVIDFKFTHAKSLYRFVIPSISVFGVVANVLNYKIYSHKTMKKSKLNWYFGMLSVSDLAMLILSNFVLAFARLAIDLRSEYLLKITNIAQIIGYPLSAISQTFNVWLTIVITVHRFFAVCYPFYERRYCSKRRCRFSVIIVLTFSVVFNISRFFEESVCDCYSNLFGSVVRSYCDSKLTSSELYKVLYRYWYITMIMFLIPFVLLVGFNIAISVTLRKTLKIQKNHDLSYNSVVVNRRRDSFVREIRPTLSLIGVVAEFLLSNLIGFVLHIVWIFDDYGEAEVPIYASDLFDAFSHTDVTLLHISAALNNILIYCLINRHFRNLLLRYLRCKCWRKSATLNSNEIAMNDT